MAKKKLSLIEHRLKKLAKVVFATFLTSDALNEVEASLQEETGKRIALEEELSKCKLQIASLSAQVATLNQLLLVYGNLQDSANKNLLDSDGVALLVPISAN